MGIERGIVRHAHGYRQARSWVQSGTLMGIERGIVRHARGYRQARSWVQSGTLMGIVRLVQGYSQARFTEVDASWT